MKLVLGLFLFLGVCLPVFAAEDDTSYIGDKDCRVSNPRPQDGERITWSGTCKDGFADGVGVLQWYLNDKPGSHFEGALRRGKLNGKVTDTKASGAILIANFENDQLIGDVDYTGANGNQYHGAWKDGPDGQGQMQYADGTLYKGEFKSGHRDGFGMATYKNGAHYEGQFVAGQYEGTGTLSYANGERYEGQFVKGQREGRGILTWPSGVRYEGTWKQGKYDGSGVMIYADGKRIAGQYKDGQRLVQAAPVPDNAPAAFNARACQPSYNAAMIAAKQEGIVRLQINVGADGKLASAVILRSSGFQELDRATINGMSRCPFTAARKDGKDVEGEIVMDYDWKLPKSETEPPILANLKGDEGVLIIDALFYMISDIEHAESEVRHVGGSPVGSLWVTNVATGKSYGGGSDGVSLYNGVGALIVPEGVYCVDTVNFANLSLSYCGEPFMKVNKGRVNNAGRWRFAWSKNGSTLIDAVQNTEEIYRLAVRTFPERFTPPAAAAGAANGGTSVAGIADVAGIYSAGHAMITANGMVTVKAYLDIDRNGKMTAYAQAVSPAGAECYVRASGADFDATLQGLTLKPGTSPDGVPDYEARIGGDTFGILAQPDDNGNLLWFFHDDKSGNYTRVHSGGASISVDNAHHATDFNGAGNSILFNDHFYSLSGKPLASPTVAELQARQCSDGIALGHSNQSHYVSKGGEVYDKQANLTWQRCSVGQQWVEGEGCHGTVRQFSFADAQKLVDGAWHIPSKDELGTLIDFYRAERNLRPAIDAEFPNIDMHKLVYWSGTAAENNKAWAVTFFAGRMISVDVSEHPSSVRLVREGQ